MPFGSAPGLRGISLEVSAGERVVIAGASGAGKTTLLRAVAGLGSSVEGRVSVAGRDVTALPAERRDLVYLHQTPLLFPHMTVGENVAFALTVRHVADRERRERSAAALRAVQLEELAGRMPHTLSGGQRHRVALARALVARPAALLLDEPLTALDPGLRAEVRDALLAVQRESGSAMLLVTHDLEEAGVLADRIGVLLEWAAGAAGESRRAVPEAGVAGGGAVSGVSQRDPGTASGGVFECVLGRFPCDAWLSGPAVAVAGADAFALEPAGGIGGTVVSVHHRPSGAVAAVDVAGVRLQVVVPAHAVPGVGAAVGIRVLGGPMVFGRDG